MPRVLLATCAELPDGDEDDSSATAALRAAGVDVASAIWDDPDVDWSAADLVVVRSTWDYTTRRDEFLDWARSVPRLANPAAVLEWNSDKTYLHALADAGVPVVPTTWYAPGHEVPEVSALDGDDVVVKPTVSGGARDTRRHRERQSARTHAVSLLEAGRSVMVQPYLEAVDTAGETGLVWMADRFSHAFRKGALLSAGAEATDGLYAQENIEARAPSAAERDTAERVLDSLESVSPLGRTALLYARVDLVPGPDGQPVLLELELVEPSLWFVADAAAPARWTAAVLRWLAGEGVSRA